MAARKNRRTVYRRHFRVTIFGSARIRRNDAVYKEIYRLARLIAEERFDIVTGGGPGLMEAANKGHREGRGVNNVHSWGLNIKLPREQKANRHLDIKKEFSRFSSRLDYFMELSNAVVVAPGGVGTLLEFFYAWQLVQVKHKRTIPIILFGKMYDGLRSWLERHPVKNGLISREDMELVFYARTCEDVIKVLRAAHVAGGE